MSNTKELCLNALLYRITICHNFVHIWPSEKLKKNWQKDNLKSRPINSLLWQNINF